MYILHRTQGCRLSVFKRKTTAGETPEFHYRFMRDGRLYTGVCNGCYTREDALTFEKQRKDMVAELSRQKSAKAIVENFRAELSGGDKVAIADCWEQFSLKPTKRAQTDGYIQKKRHRWEAFAQYMRTHHPDVVFLHDVTQKIAEDYISELRRSNIASSTANLHQKCLAEIFSRMCYGENPFRNIPLCRERQECREAFTPDELERIMQEAPPFIRAIFLIGFFTALREGDISTLRWSDVLWEQGVVRRKLLKTGAVVEIPIMPPLAAFLHEQEGKDGEYVLPEHAAMYRANPSGISYRVKKFLEGIGIETTKKVPGRSRAVSIKDVHSLRHTFCYFAGVAGIPLVVVQSIVGHMTPEMTAHYTAHADRRTKREKLAALPCFSALVKETRRKVLVEQMRRACLRAVKEADDATLNRVASILLPVKPKRSLLRNTEPGKSK